jgi:hypothetical protein
MLHLTIITPSAAAASGALPNYLLAKVSSCCRGCISRIVFHSGKVPKSSRFSRSEPIFAGNSPISYTSKVSSVFAYCKYQLKSLSDQRGTLHEPQELAASESMHPQPTKMLSRPLSFDDSLQHDRDTIASKIGSM